MGRDKSLLMLDGERLIERVVGRLAQVADERLVSTNHPERYPFLADRVRFVPDEGGTGQGPLAGIASLLAAATHDRVLIVATDMPCLNVALLRHMASLPTRADVVIPIHYNTWPVIEQDPERFRALVGDAARVEILSPGGGHEF